MPESEQRSADMSAEAFDEFCRRLHPQVVGSMTLYCGDADAAQDFAQEAFARALKDWLRVSALRSPEAWVFRVAMNLAHSWYRRLRRPHRPATRQLAAVPAEDALALRSAVNGLPRRQRQVVILRFFLDWSVTRTAEVLGIADGTVRALTSQAVQSLRTALGREWKDWTDD